MINESIPYFDYEMFEVTENNDKDFDTMVKILKILLEPFDDLTKLIIIEALFGDKK